MDILPPILLQILFIALTAFFTTAEAAVVAINDSKLASLTAKGDKRAKRISKLTEKPSAFLNTVKSAVMLLTLLGGACTAYAFGDRLTAKIWTVSPAFFEKMPYGFWASLMILACILLYAILLHVFGYAIPKRLASKKSDELALKISLPIVFFVSLFKPLAALESLLAGGILRLLGKPSNEEDEQVTEEEIRIMVDVGSENGTIDESEKEIIQNVFEFDDLSASDVATHRTDITMLWAEESDEEWDTIITSTSFSRYPVCEESVDKIIGVLSTRDYLTLEDKSRESVMANAVKPAYFVPESVKADVLFKNMKERKEFFAVVLDEYGGVSGIVTINDLLERLVGEFNTPEEDEANDEPAIRQIEDNRWIIQGETEIAEVIEALGEVIEEDTDADTFSGYVLGLHGTIPTDGSTFEVETDSLSIHVLTVKDHVIEECEVLLKASESEDNDEDKDSKKEKSEPAKNETT